MRCVTFVRECLRCVTKASASTLLSFARCRLGRSVELCKFMLEVQLVERSCLVLGARSKLQGCLLISCAWVLAYLLSHARSYQYWGLFVAILIVKLFVVVSMLFHDLVDQWATTAIERRWRSEMVLLTPSSMSSASRPLRLLGSHFVVILASVPWSCCCRPEPNRLLGATRYDSISTVFRTRNFVRK